MFLPKRGQDSGRVIQMLHLSWGLYAVTVEDGARIPFHIHPPAWGGSYGYGCKEDRQAPSLEMDDHGPF